MKVECRTSRAHRRMLAYLADQIVPAVRDKELDANARRGLEEMREQGIIELVRVEVQGQDPYQLVQITIVGKAILAAMRNGIFDEEWDIAEVNVDIPDSFLRKPKE